MTQRSRRVEREEEKEDEDGERTTTKGISSKKLAPPKTQ